MQRLNSKLLFSILRSSSRAVELISLKAALQLTLVERFSSL